jgi:hypothetical protein
LGLIGAGCASERSAPPSANVDDGGCLNDPIGRSPPPPADCLHILPSSDDCPTAVPSFDGDVEPILASRCKLCHSPNGIAQGIQFDTYAEAFSWYKVMYTQVFACTMPPSCVGPLPDAERQTLLKWFVCKAPLGPVPPVDAQVSDRTSPVDAQADSQVDAQVDSELVDASDDSFDGGDL